MPRGGRSWSREVDLLDFAETAARAFVRLPSTVSFRAHTWPSFCFLLLCCGRSLPGLYGLGPPLASPLPIDLMRASGLVLDLALPKKKKDRSLPGFHGTCYGLWFGWDWIQWAPHGCGLIRFGSVPGVFFLLLFFFLHGI